MILFKEDWDKYPAAAPDWTTKNTSFLRMSQLYATMGVKNNAFHLALFDQGLKGIDPHKYDSSRELQLRIALEAKDNYWYYLRELVKAPAVAGAGNRPFIANRANLAASWLFFNHVAPYIVQPRQTGKSFFSNTMGTYLLNIRCADSEISLLTKDDTLRSETMDRIKEIEKTLPIFMQVRNKSDRSNTEELTINALGNVYRGHLPSKSEKQAINVGRGLSPLILFGDELAFLFNIGISLPAALGGGGAVRDIAEEMGEPYCNVFTTTAGKIDDRDGSYAYNLLQDAAMWSEFYFDLLNQQELHKVIIAASRAEDLIVDCSFNHRQLGYTDDWLARKIRDAKSKGEDAERDFLNKWTNSSMTSPLTQPLIRIIEASKKEEEYVEVVNFYQYAIRWQVKKHDIEKTMLRKTVMGLDTSNAGGRDDIAFVIRDIETGEVLACSNINETNIVKFGEFLGDLMIQYPNMTLIIENRSSGSYIIDYLVRKLLACGESPHKRLYNIIVDDKPSRGDYKGAELINAPITPYLEDLYAKYKSSFGFTTSGTGRFSRQELYTVTLTEAARITGHVTRDRKLIQQLFTLIVVNNRVDHPAGAHDDLVIAWMLSFWFLTKSKNLEHYGIKTQRVLSEARRATEDTFGRDDRIKEQRRLLMDSIEAIGKKMVQTHDQMQKSIYESKIHALAYDLGKLPSNNEKFVAADFIAGLRSRAREQRLAYIRSK